LTLLRVVRETILYDERTSINAKLHTMTAKHERLPAPLALT
jgi:hypothetical protein